MKTLVIAAVVIEVSAPSSRASSRAQSSRWLPILTTQGLTFGTRAPYLRLLAPLPLVTNDEHVYHAVSKSLALDSSSSIEHFLLSCSFEQLLFLKTRLLIQLLLPSDGLTLIPIPRMSSGPEGP